ncbi:glycosyltransferase family 2 protein [Candidatus Dojkabacteria bacterium]|nr:glycosyltransferase family 2 protein [Candidatus Dojkabacteria bacterium]
MSKNTIRNIEKSDRNKCILSNLPKTEFCILMLNWNTTKDTIEALESMKKLEMNKMEVFLLFVGEKKEEIERIQNVFPTIHIYQVPKNLGFAEGNNYLYRKAIAMFDPKYILLLNTDVVVKENLLSTLSKILENDPNIGIAGVTNYYYHDPSKIWYNGGKINKISGTTSHVEDKISTERLYQETGYVVGSCLAIRTEIVRKLAEIFDSKLFSYTEDVDLNLNVQELGYKTVVTSRTSILHKVSPVAPKNTPFRMFFESRNRILVMRRHTDTLGFLVFITNFLIFKIPIWIIRVIVSGNISSVAAIFKGVLDGLGLISSNSDYTK